MSRPSGARAALAGLLLCTAAGCGADPSGADSRLQVLVSSYPLQYVAEEIGGEHVAVANLTPPGGDTHGLEPAPRDVAAVGEADLVVHLSGGMQPAVDEAIAQERPDHLVDAASVADRGADPHFWLDPLRLAEVGEQVADELAAVDPGHAADYAERGERLVTMLRQLDQEYADTLAHCRGATLVAAHEAFGYLTDRYGLRQVADELAAVDPGHAADYADRGERLVTMLRQLDQEYADTLAPCRGATLVAAHEAFGYLADRYGLRQVGVAGLDPHVEPPPSRVRDAAEAVQETGARTVFFEAAAGSSVAEVLAADLGLATDVLHPIERVDADETYPELMAANLVALRQGLTCG